MSEYDGFATVQDPRDYMNAPATLIQSPGDNDAGPRQLPPILSAAIDATRDFELLSADEIQAHYKEQNVLQQRIADVVARLDIEVKMREAARSLSRLHRKPSEASMSPSVATRSPGKSTRKRISKIFGSSGGEQGSGDMEVRTVGQHRLSMQADEEAEISSGKIQSLEQQRFDLSQRQALVSRRIIQHHAAVMARALSGVPLPNHRRIQSGASGMSLLSNTSTPGPRQSWVVAQSPGPHSGRHSRNVSGVSAHSIGMDSSLATVREHAPSSRGTQVSQASQATAKTSQLEEEVSSLAARISKAIPMMSPTPQGNVAFISNAFERLMWELTDTRNSAEAYHIQAQHSEERIAFLNRELEQAGGTLGSANTSSAVLANDRQGSPGHRDLSRDLSRDTSRDAEVAQLRHEIEAERSTMQQLRAHSSQQRAELDRTVRSLEDVTRLAVQYESDRKDFEQLLSTIEARADALERDKGELLQQRLGATSNSSLLCKEFQRIVSDLVEQHQKDLRQLYPKVAQPILPSTGQTSPLQGSLSRPTHERMSDDDMAAAVPAVHAAHAAHAASLDQRRAAPPLDPRRTHRPGSSVGNGTISGNGHAYATPSSATASHDLPPEPDRRSVDGLNFASGQQVRPESAFNSEFSQSPEPLSVHSAVRKPVPAAALRDIGLSEQPGESNETPLHTDPQGEAMATTEIHSLRGPQNGRGHTPLPAPMDYDDSPLAIPRDQSFPQLDRRGSEYSEDFSESSSIYPEANSAIQSQVSVLPRPDAVNKSQASIARAQEYSFNSGDELL